MRPAKRRTVIALAPLLIVAGVLGGPALAQAQDAALAEPDPWGPLRLLEGTWEGAIEGRLGQGVGRRRYERILGERYLLMRHASVRQPQEKSPEGDYHRELGVFSYDRERKTIVLREFFIEGYVTRAPCAVEPTRLVCTAESVEGGAGMQARLTLTVADAYRFEETFELAGPGDELSIYFTNTWRRVPDLDD